MMNKEGIIGSGLALLRREQRILWWTFAVNLLLASFSSLAFTARLAPILDSSLLSRRLYTSFDLPAFVELLQNPATGLPAQMAGSAGYALVFFVFMLFISGGVLSALRAETRLTSAEFFQACGAYLGRMVRLSIVLLIALAPVTTLAGAIHKLAGKLSAAGSAERLGFWVEVAGAFIALLLVMAVRLWFDLAQVHAVSENELRVARSIACGWRITRKNFARLFWMYLRISVLGWIVLGAAVWTWLRLPHSAVAATFILGEVVTLTWLATRLWQRACEVSWYESYRAASALDVSPEVVVLSQPSTPGSDFSLS